MSVGTIRSTILARIVKALDERFGQTDFLLHSEGLSRAALDNTYNLISLKRYVSFFESAADAVGDRSLGLRIGAMIEPNDLGPIGALFANADHLGSALNDLSRCIAALQSATAMHFSASAQSGRLTYQIFDPRIGVRAQDSEFTLSAICQLIRLVVDARWSPLEIHFRHPRTTASTLADAFFKAPVKYGMPVDAVLFRSGDLKQCIPARNENAREFLERHIADLIQHSEYSSVTTMVSATIAILLPYCSPTLSRISEETGYSERTLQRLLCAEGTSIRALLQQQRQTQADTMLLSNTKSHDEIARALGYADGTVFWRAYKSWTGRAPSRRRDPL